MKERILTVFEHDAVRIGHGANRSEVCLSSRELTELELFHDKSRGKYYSLIHNGVKFNSYVGVIRVGSLTIEVLPKADKSLNQTSDVGTKNYWRSILLGMIKQSGLLNIELLPDAKLSLSQVSLLHIFIEAYLTEVQTLLHQGLLKQYKLSNGCLTSLKGRIHFPNNLKKNFAHKERLFCAYQTYTYSTPINQILFTALNIVRTLYIDSPIHDKASRLIFNFPEIIPDKITPNHFERISWSRKNSSFKRAVQLARLIILHFSPTLKSGSESILAILFDMNQLWERYIFSELKRNQKDSNYTVQAQRSIPFWQSHTIRPDIVLRTPTSTIVIDTKWKLPDSRGPSDSDLKQMFAYNEYFQTSHSFLIYPSGHTNTPHTGLFHHNKTTTSTLFVQPKPTTRERPNWIDGVLSNN